MKNKISYMLKQTEVKDYLAPFIGTIIVFIVGQIIAPGFSSRTGIINMLATSSVLILACFPQLISMISGKSGIDLSLGALMSLSVAWGGALSGGTAGGLVLSMLAMAGVGLICGLCNGIAVQYWGVPAMVVTLCVGNLLDEFYLVVTKGAPSGRVAQVLLDFGAARILGGIRVVFLVAIIFAVIVELLLRKTRTGKKIYMIGTNWKASEMSGIKSKQLGTLVYVLGAVVSTLAGFVLLATTGSSQAGVGSSYTMLAVAAVVIGGVNVAGGKGTYIGAALGAIFISVLTGLLLVVQIPDGCRDMIKGLILMAILLAYSRGAKIRQ